MVWLSISLLVSLLLLISPFAIGLIWLGTFFVSVSVWADLIFLFLLVAPVLAALLLVARLVAHPCNLLRTNHCHSLFGRFQFSVMISMLYRTLRYF